MAKFNPDFWEVTISSESWQQFADTARMGYANPDELAEWHERLGRAQALWPKVEQLLAEAPTNKQREVLVLYFLEELNQRQIAERLGISQQSVSEHLYGKMRSGHAIGGALRKLRKACADHGLQTD